MYYIFWIKFSSEKKFWNVALKLKNFCRSGLNSISSVRKEMYKKLEKYCSEKYYSILFKNRGPECTQWVHPEARLLTERSVSSCIWLAYSRSHIRSKNIDQTDTKAYWVYWALNEQSWFWMHVINTLSREEDRFSILKWGKNYKSERIY